MPKILINLPKIIILGLVGLNLVACGEATAVPTSRPATVATALTPVPSISALVATTVATIAPATVTVSTSPSAQVVPTVTRLVVTPISSSIAATTPTQAQAKPATKDEIQAVLKNFADNAKNYNFKLTQTATIKSGTSITKVEANGTGRYFAPNLYQKLDLNFGGQIQSIEYYLNNITGYQRSNALALWRKLASTLPTSANLPTTLPNEAGGFQSSVVGQAQTQLRYTFPAALLFSQKDLAGPELLGLLSSANLYQPFLSSPDRQAQAEVKLLLNSPASLLIGREISFSLTGPTSNLSYRAVYQFSEVNSSSVAGLTPPPNLPR